jgi:plasmid stabilization system protein ParE
MRVTFHSGVQADIRAILRRYDQISARLVDEFWDELNSIIESISATPLRFHPEVRDLRRVSLKRYPYHILYRVLSDRVRIIAVRHHKQHPRTALRRR